MNEDRVDAVARAICMELYGGHPLSIEDREKWPQWAGAMRAARAAIQALGNSAEVEFQMFDSSGDFCAEASGPRASMVSEALHYAARYSQDGPVRVDELIRIPFFNESLMRSLTALAPPLSGAINGG